MAKDNKSKGYQLASALLVGCIIIGAAIGILTENPAIGSLLGVGVGLIVSALAKTFIK